ncbi:TetR/AcrR family transcriptional regulator [Kitasatospora gansuensis]
MNQDRRNLLRDAAIEVLASAGGRGLTHRAVDAAAEVPVGTAKNYFPTREALLRAAAERCVEQYGQVAAQMTAAPRALRPRGAGGPVRGLLENVAGPGRPRMLAYFELRSEAARDPQLSAILDQIATDDFTGLELAQRAAGLPVTPQSAAIVTLALHGAILHLLVDTPSTLATTAAGLENLDHFARNLIGTVYPQNPDDRRHAQVQQ